MLVKCFTRAHCPNCQHSHLGRNCELDIENQCQPVKCPCVQNQDHPEHPHGQLCEQLIEVPVYKTVYEDKKVTKLRIETTETTVTSRDGQKVTKKQVTHIPYEVVEPVAIKEIDYYKKERCPCSRCKYGKCCRPRIKCECTYNAKPNFLFYFCLFFIWLPPVYCLIRSFIQEYGPACFRHGNGHQCLKTFWVFAGFALFACLFVYALSSWAGLPLPFFSS